MLIRVPHRAFPALVAFFLVATALSAQYSVNPNDAMYTDLSLWEGAGYITHPPLMRPYPEQTLVALLQEVVRRGDRESAARARAYLVELNGSIAIGASVRQENRTDGDDYAGRFGIGAEVAGSLTPAIRYAGGITGWILDVEKGELLPDQQRTTYDIVEDNAKIDALGREIETLLEVQSGVAIGNESFHFQAAIGRKSFGPFHDDSLVVSRYAPQSANFVLSYEGERFAYTGALFSLRPQSLYQSIDTLEEWDEAEVIYRRDAPDTSSLAYRVLEATSIYDKEGPGKFLHLQAYTFRPSPRLSMTLFESVVFGPVFQVGYLVPFKFLWQAQSLTSFADNSFIGLTADFRAAPRLRVPVMLYVDDANFNDIVSLDLNTKYNLGAQAGIIWTPLDGALRQVELDYTAVTPYMYVHDGPGQYSSDFNYTNYVHGMTSLGTGLDPNSDRLSLRVRTRPMERLSVDFVGRIMRHGNASDGVLDGYGNDGSIYDDGRFADYEEPVDYDPDSGEEYAAVYDQGDASYQFEFRFLTQEEIETTWHAGVDVGYAIPLERSTLVLDAGYLFEYVNQPLAYVWDPVEFKGETVALENTTSHFVSFGVTYSY